MISHDTMLVVAGGFISGVVVLLVQYWINNWGKTKIYYKVISIPGQNKRDNKGWGVIEDGRNLIFAIPMNIELQNTSNVTKSVRDYALHLFNGEEHIAKMAQMDYIKGSTPVEYGSDNNAYSFTLVPRSIQKQKCLFLYTIDKSQRHAIQFDTIKARYYDEKDRAHWHTITNQLCDCWEPRLFEPDEEWILFVE